MKFNSWKILINKIKRDFNLLFAGNLFSFLLLAVLIFSIALTNIIAAALLITFFLFIIRQKDSITYDFLFSYPILILVFLRIVSIFFSVNISESTKILYTEIPYYFLLFPLYNFLKYNIDKNFIIIGKIFKYAGAISSFIGFYIVFSGVAPRATSTSYGFTSLGIFLIVCLTFLLFAECKGGVFKNKYEQYFFIAIIIAGIIFTYNRTHWVIMFLLIVFFALYKKAYLPLLIFLILSVLAFIFIPAIKERLIQIIYIKNFMSDRDILWKGGIELLLSRPLTGFGPNSFHYIFQYQNQMSDKLVGSWHNDYMQLYLESGIFTLLTLLYIIYKVVITFFKNIRVQNITSRNFLISVFISLLILLLGGGFLDSMGNILFKYLLVFLALSVTNTIKKQI